MLGVGSELYKLYTLLSSSTVQGITCCMNIALRCCSIHLHIMNIIVQEV